MLFRNLSCIPCIFIRKKGVKTQSQSISIKKRLSRTHGNILFQIVGYPQVLKGYCPYYDCRPFRFTSTFLTLIFLNSFSIFLQNFCVNTLFLKNEKSLLFLLEVSRNFDILEEICTFLYKKEDYSHGFERHNPGI